MKKSVTFLNPLKAPCLKVVKLIVRFIFEMTLSVSEICQNFIELITKYGVYLIETRKTKFFKTLLLLFMLTLFIMNACQRYYAILTFLSCPTAVTVKVFITCLYINVYYSTKCNFNFLGLIINHKYFLRLHFGQ